MKLTLRVLWVPTINSSLVLGSFHIFVMPCASISNKCCINWILSRALVGGDREGFACKPYVASGQNSD